MNVKTFICRVTVVKKLLATPTRLVTSLVGAATCSTYKCGDFVAFMPSQQPTKVKVIPELQLDLLPADKRTLRFAILDIHSTADNG